MAAYQLVAPPVVEPVSLQQVKSWIKQDQDDDDPLILGLIAAARDLCETFTQRAFVTQTWNMVMDAFPGYVDHRNVGQQSIRTLSSGAWELLGNRWGFVLPFSPVSAVNSLTYNDQYGNAMTMTSGVNYFADIISSPARVVPVFATFWPLTQYAPNAITCNFTCGYGVPTFDPDGNPLSNPVPQAICTAILFLVSWMYNNRDSQIVTTAVIHDNPTLMSLLWQYKVVRF